MAENKLTWMIGGKAGFGIMDSGIIFSKCFSKGGLSVFGAIDYQSLIRGGHQTMHIRVEDQDIRSNIGIIDILVALNKETVDKHKDKISWQGGIIFDSSETPVGKNEIRSDIRLYDIPLANIVKEINGKPVMKNIVSIGASIALVGYDFRFLQETIEDTFKEKSAEIIKEDLSAARAGYDYVKKNFPSDFKNRMRSISSKKKMLITGNQAVSIGAIRAGCKFYAAYPMTPSSPILHYMAAHERKKNIVVKQTEDEIAAIHAVIGASFAGVRAMCATSGGGFCLMVEGLGLAAMIETPIVVVEGERPGPSTGFPTRTEQGDLKFVINASQGEFPRIVIAPGDVDECFYMTEEAFNLADKFQVPVIILTDTHVAESLQTTDRFSTDYTVNRGALLTDEKAAEMKDYKRFQATGTGISPRAIPGQKNCVFRAFSYEHNEYGFDDESAENRIKMVDKRNRKIEHILNAIPDPKFYGPSSKDAQMTLVSWGSTKGASLEAIKMLKNEGIAANLLHFAYVWPFKADAAKKMLESCKRTMIVEQNKTLQFAGIIREKTGILIKDSFSKYDGRQMLPEEISSRVKEVLSGKA